jgi:hypothetical protein
VIIAIAVVVIWRIGKAFLAVYRLLRDTHMLRTLPWSYIKRLPLRDVWIGLAFVTLVVGAVAVVGTLVLPSALASTTAGIGLIALWLGVVSSWVRLFSQAWRARRS